MDQLVYVYDEYPQSVENMYVPHCVVVRRCSGYCSDEGFKCLPTLERNTTLQVNQVLFTSIVFIITLQQQLPRGTLLLEKDTTILARKPQHSDDPL